MTGYHDGRRSEHKVRDELIANGYDVLRTAGSKGAVDLVACKIGQLLFVQVKRTGSLGPQAWNRLYDLAVCVGAVPILAEHLPRHPIRYRRLAARKTGLGRQPFTDFTIDAAAAAEETPC